MEYQTSHVKNFHHIFIMTGRKPFEIKFYIHQQMHLFVSLRKH